MSAFEDFVNTELPLRTNIGSLPSADKYARFTGVGRTVEARTAAQVLSDIAAARENANYFARMFYIHDVALTDDFPMWFVPKAITVTSITGVTVPGSGTTAAFNIERRPRYTPNGSGTDLMASDLTADDTGEEQTTIVASGAVAARQWLAPAFSGTPDATKLWIVVEGTID